jgi:hypothetical protein
MRKTFNLPNEPWCFPTPPPRDPSADRTERWCFPDAPPRVPSADPDEPWCFPDAPPRPRKRGRPRSWLA